MIEYVEGSIFESGAAVLVNPVNTIGVSGKGLASEFACWFPRGQREYERACAQHIVRVGHPFVSSAHAPLWLVYFPTKQHWRDPSRLEWIRWGLESLRVFAGALEWPSLALPALGCGLGGLDWNEVRQLIEHRLGDLDARVMVYPPRG